MKIEENHLRMAKLILNYALYGIVIHYVYKLLDSLIFIAQCMYR